MSLWHIAWGYLWNRRLPTSMTVLSVALAVALISSVLTLREETRKRFEEEGGAFDIVVGAKGSPLQLVLSTVYLMDTPTGNILLSDYERIKRHEDVAAAFPISLGDTFHGFRIVGTDPALFDFEWTPSSGDEVRRPFQIEDGRLFEAPFEAVVGSTVAREERLKLGDTFIGTHGFMDLPDEIAHKHEDAPYTVVGIMKPSGGPFDRAIFANLESVWQVHAHEDEHEDHDHEEYHGPVRPGVHEEDAAHIGHSANEEITAVLVDLASPALRFQFREYVNADYNAMAASPISQVAKLYDQLLGTAKTVLLAVGYLVVVISALSILIGLYLSILQRRRDLAIMRALGASRSEIFGSVIIEALLVTVLGVAAGWCLGGAVSGGIGVYLGERYGLYVQPFVTTTEHLLAFGTVAFMGLLAGVLPGWQAYRTDVARDLAQL